MTDSIKDLLTNKNFEQPDEIQTIKNFVLEKYGETPQVKINNDLIIITVSSGALASSLRMELHILQQNIQSKKRLVIRIG